MTLIDAVRGKKGITEGGREGNCNGQYRRNN